MDDGSSSESAASGYIPGVGDLTDLPDDTAFAGGDLSVLDTSSGGSSSGSSPNLTTIAIYGAIAIVGIVLLKKFA